MAEQKQHDVGLVIARVLIGGMFIVMGWYKVTNCDELTKYLADWNFPAPAAFAWAASLLELVGGLALAVGVLPGLVALALAAYLVPATVLFHGNTADPDQVTELLKNTGIIGGLLAVWATRGGRIRIR